MTEKRIEQVFNNTVKECGGMSIKLVPLHIMGLPDRLALLPGGIVLFAELKSPGKKPRAIQEVIINKIRGLGFEVLVIDSTNKAREYVKERAAARLSK